jgi:hypothetical protein
MNRLTIGLIGSGLAGLSSLSTVVGAQHGHDRPAIGEEIHAGTTPDDRVVLNLSRLAEAGLKLTMREHLEALQAIVASLGRQDFERAAKVAREELGFPKHHQAMEREAGTTFPPKYHELAMSHHREAEDLADAIPSKNLARILPRLGKTIAVCVACHRAYKL